MLEFEAGILSGEAPIDSSRGLVPYFLPSSDLALERLSVGKPAVQALGRQDCQLDFRGVEPTLMLWRLVNLQLIR